MPQIIIKGLNEEQCAELSVKSAPELARICNCPSDWFTFDLVRSRFYDKNGKIAPYPVVQVWWYERPMEVQDKVAKFLHKQFENMGFHCDQISFHIFEKERYYENGDKC